MKRVFICSPYAGDIEINTIKAKEYCRWAKKVKGVNPFAPHLYYPLFLEECIEEEREEGIQAGLDMLRDCDELWRFGFYHSIGMAREMELAEELGIPIRRFDENFKEICKGEN